MFFWDFRTTLASHRAIFDKNIKEKDALRFYESLLYELDIVANHNTEFYAASHNQMVIERDWYEKGRPFYNVWPGILPFFMKLKFEKVPSDLLRLPIEPLLIRLPKHEALKIDEKHSLRAMLCSRFLIPAKDGFEERDGFYVWIDFGESEPEDERMPVHSYRNLPIHAGDDIEDALHKLRIGASMAHGISIPPGILEDTIRIVTACCLLAQGDDDIIEPQVLGRDEAGFARTHDDKYIERAKRYGIQGWNIGRHVTVSPHYRSGGPAIYWIGKGHSTPVIKIRKGAIVHKNIAMEIPTGFGEEQHS